MPAQNQADKLVFRFILDFIEFVHKFYEENIEIFNVYKVSGITPTPHHCCSFLNYCSDAAMITGKG